MEEKQRTLTVESSYTATTVKPQCPVPHASGTRRERERKAEEGESSPASVHPSTSLHLPEIVPSPTRAGAILAQKKFKQDHSHLAKITDCLISRFLPLHEGERNTVLTCEIAPRLFGAMGRDAANTVLRHLIETDLLGGFGHAWAALEREYPTTLASDERECLLAMDDAELAGPSASAAALRPSAMPLSPPGASTSPAVLSRSGWASCSAKAIQIATPPPGCSSS